MPILKKGNNRNTALLKSLRRHFRNMEMNVSPEKRLGCTKSYLRDKTPAERKMLIAEWRERIRIRKEIVDIFAKYLEKAKENFPFVKGAYLFGSFATGNIRPKDLDILVVIDRPAMSKYKIRDPLFPYKWVTSQLSDLAIRLRQSKQPALDIVGCLPFDPKHPESASTNLQTIRREFRGDPHVSGKEKHKFPFELRAWNFVGTDKKIVDMFIGQWNKVKNMKFI